MDVSIIIVNYNTKDLTNQCIESIRTNTVGLSYEIILVDNGSVDGSKEFFECSNEIVYVYSDYNLGFGKANNLGFTKASGKYIFLLNSDTILMNNAIKMFFDYMEHAMMNIACCGCFLRNSQNEIIHSYGRFHTFWNSISEWCLQPYLLHLGINLHKYDYPIKKQKYCEVEYITGAAVFLRKEVADKYGLFDPDFIMYSEDVEMAKRYSMHNYKSFLLDTPRIVHLEGMSYSNKRYNYVKQIMGIRSLFLYENKYMGKLEYSLYIKIFKILYCLCFAVRNIPFNIKIQHIKVVAKIKI